MIKPNPQGGNKTFFNHFGASPLTLDLNKRKVERMKIEVAYRRRDEAVDFYIANFYRSSERRVSLQRKCKRVVDVSEQKVAPASSRPRPCRRTRRVLDTTRVLRAPLSALTFDHYFLNIWESSPEEKRNQCTYMSCFFFCLYSNEHSRVRALKWIKRTNIFSKKYVLVPIVLGYHWYLLILCHFGERIHSKTRTPCILLLDSMHTLDRPQLKPLIRSFVLDVYETKNRIEDKALIKKIPLLIPKVPQQRNGKECGVFCLFYVSLFLKCAPENFSTSWGYPYSMDEDWFTEDQLEGFYKKLEWIGIESSAEELDSSEFNGCADVEYPLEKQPV